MSRLIDLDIRRGRIWISCPYDVQTMAVIKSVPEREFDSDSRRWFVPLRHVGVAWQRLEPLHFRFTPRMRDWWKEHRDRLETPPAEEVFEVDPSDGFTVARLNAEARQVLTRHFDEIWIVAEVDSFARNKPNGHAYFELVDRLGGEAIARVRAVMFAATRRQIEGALPDDMKFGDGLRVRLRGKVELYMGSGSFQIVVEGVDVEWAIGARRKKRDEVVARLGDEGVAGANLALPLPVLPLRIGLVTAAGSDAYNDFVHELERSGFGFEVFFAAASVQGHAAERTIVRALDALGAIKPPLDAVVVTRGGGAKGDLAAFDAYSIGRRVCELSVKVIAGIGHQRDQSVLDFVALSEKTPTAAAQRLIQAVESAADRVERATSAVVTHSTSRLESSARKVDRLASAGTRFATRRLVVAQRTVDHAASTASASARRRLDGAKRRTNVAAQRIQRTASSRTERARRDVDRHALILGERAGISAERAQVRLSRSEESLSRAAATAVTQLGLRLKAVAATLRLADPRRVLERGYALVRDSDGHIIMDAETFAGQRSARLQFRDGAVDVQPQSAVIPPESEDE